MLDLVQGIIVIEGRPALLVHLPKNPIDLLPITDGGTPELRLHARALDLGIRRGYIKGLGIYAIEIFENEWAIHEMRERQIES